MPFKLDADGHIIGDDGEALVDSSGRKIKLDGVVTQDTLDKTLSARIKGEREKFEKQRQDLIESYEKQLKSASSPQEAEDLRKKIAELEEANLSKDQAAAKQVQRARAEADAEIQNARKSASEWENRFKSLRIETDLVQAAAKIGFVDPADAVLNLMSTAVWEQKTGDDGKPTGEWGYAFPMEVADGEKKVVKNLDAEKATAYIAEKKPHLIASKSKGGFSRTTPSAPGGQGNSQDPKNLSADERLKVALNGGGQRKSAAA
jgi:hypothetical protein